MTTYPYIWVWGKYPTDHARKGKRCRVLARSLRMNSALVEFEDGFRVITSRNGLRKAEK